MTAQLPLTAPRICSDVRNWIDGIGGIDRPINEPGDNLIALNVRHRDLAVEVDFHDFNQAADVVDRVVHGDIRIPVKYGLDVIEKGGVVNWSDLRLRLHEFSRGSSAAWPLISQHAQRA
ncbi:hypothetical protein ACFV0O_31635 [Kitasatospora sp. NPDC059577]|uniref:hypothetical protein n=1 Tax=unclassified Kitasatospora TaxID=2633591 RepID=UPI00367AEADE